jgi:DNA-directed RNA polymerase subunit RPC12/RpoP
MLYGKRAGASVFSASTGTAARESIAPMNGDSPNQTWTVCTCTNCSGHLEFDASRAGETIQCPHCKHETTLFIPDKAEKPPAEEPTPKSEPKKAKLVEYTTYRGGMESQLDVVGYVSLIFGVCGGFFSLFCAGISLTENADKKAVLFLFIVGIIALWQGFVFNTLFRGGAEVIRLLKKSNGLKFSGEVSPPTISHGYRCSACGTWLAAGDLSKCNSCGAEFEL